MTPDEDFLDEMVNERSAVTPAFAGMVDAAYERRLALRARTGRPAGATMRADSGRRDRGETDEHRET